MSDYDRAITVFSPDGHLLQVQYAAEAVSRGLCAVAVKSKDGVCVAVERRVLAKLQDSRSARKIEIIDDGLALAFSGLSADGRALVNRARVECQSYRLRAAEAPGCDYVARWIAQLQQRFTMRGGMRPFGVACLIAGYDAAGSPALFKTEPHGIVVGLKAYAIGRSEKTIQEYFEKEYKENMTQDEAIKLAIAGLSQVVDAGSNTVEAVLVKRDENNQAVVVPLSDQEITQHISKPAAQNDAQNDAAMRED
ncbi:proteasome subunit alpha type [Gregarina niphandrodes]|uniref:Proteasome subunit alpha type n=1 Tax=Gregarina niphandrodes TaxID=110365 RepID=A0A023AV52_GRENI|nr:proteasome subunit alpha type [Gregarina niphandrodes]EZG42659.1 proteasome subunit alpha type [Gregarina niphandrodes]|eukprot:XP_011134802.1 proteasome subunit alpha type [Gregarina niphandrodes]